MMKRNQKLTIIIAVALIAALALMLCACSNPDDGNNDGNGGNNGNGGGGTISVTFNMNGGGGSNEIVTATTGELITAPADPQKNGESFIGWYTEASGGTKWDFATDKAPEENFVLYARWSGASCTIKFDGNNGYHDPNLVDKTGLGTAVPDQSIPIGSTATLSLNTFEMVGYNFAGWKVREGALAGTIFADGAEFTPTESFCRMDAQWTPKTDNKIIFDGNGATSGTMAVQNATTNATTALTANAFARTGYTFAGWALTAGGAVAYGDTADYNIGTNAEVTLFAVWTQN